MEAKDGGSKDEGGEVKDDRFEEQPPPFAAESKDDQMSRLDSRDQEAAEPDARGEADVKIILLGDSAVGKSKLVERYMMDDYNPTQLSTFALNTFRKTCTVGGRKKVVEFWDTAGQERFQKVHPAYYDGADACILVFDVMRKATYQHLPVWFDELRGGAGRIPTICVANKIDMNIKVTGKSFKFPEQHGLPFFFVSAADGTNVVKVFEQAVEEAVRHREKVADMVSKGEFDDGVMGGGDMQFMAEVRETMKYFDEKEST
mmetsp:Transcript_65316/g.131357  ORF Transcript_65316/g.131357 Transcript_65316/m.131357 type:complete len:259 (-) Transcript_65316:348-1124(-)